MLNFNDLTEARAQLEGWEENLINNLDGTYIKEVVIDDTVKQLDSGEVVESSASGQLEDGPGEQLDLDALATLVGP